MSRLPLRLRLTLVFATTMAVVLTAVGFFVYIRVGGELLTSVDQSLRAGAGETLDHVKRDGALTDPDVRLVDPDQARGETLAQVLDGRGKVVRSSAAGLAPLVSGSTVAHVLGGAKVLQTSELPGRKSVWRVYALPVQTAGKTQVLVFASSLASRQETLDRLLTELAVAGPIALLLASLAGYALAAATLRHVESMRRRAAEISASTPGLRLPVPGSRDEIARLAETLNDMLGRLEAAFEHERRFVADASHELRTPLALLRTELELALRRPRTYDEQRAALESAAEETERLTRLAEDLLLIARSDQGGLPIRREHVDVAELLRSTAERFSARAAASGREIHVACDPGVVVDADPTRLEQALGNLIENALVHGAGRIELSARGVGTVVEIHVVDQGTGFPPGFAARAFDRFSRADDVRGERRHRARAVDRRPDRPRARGRGRRRRRPGRWSRRLDQARAGAAGRRRGARAGSPLDRRVNSSHWGFICPWWTGHRAGRATQAFPPERPQPGPQAASGHDPRPDGRDRRPDRRLRRARRPGERRPQAPASGAADPDRPARPPRASPDEQGPAATLAARAQLGRRGAGRAGTVSGTSVPGSAAELLAAGGRLRRLVSAASCSFPALGTTATLVVTDPSGLAAARSALEAELQAVDETCSRFRSDSELVRLNAGAGRWVTVGDNLLRAIEVALHAAVATGGLCDPTIGRALRLAGYDRTFELVRRRDGRTFRVGFAPVARWESVELDTDRKRVRVPEGVELDLGATAKALAADRSARAAATAAGCGALVSLGGDVSVAGEPPADGWPVRIADSHSASPDSPGPVISIRSGGLASSSTTVRHWRAGSAELHHILDPRTGRPADRAWRTVSVAAATCVDANAASTAAIVLGSEAPAWLEERALPSRLVGETGETMRVAGWPAEAA